MTGAGQNRICPNKEPPCDPNGVGRLANCNDLEMENGSTCVQGPFRPGITATDCPLKPALAANEPAFDGANPHCTSTGQDSLRLNTIPRTRRREQDLWTEFMELKHRASRPEIACIHASPENPDLMYALDAVISGRKGH